MILVCDCVGSMRILLRLDSCFALLGRCAIVLGYSAISDGLDCCALRLCFRRGAGVGGLLGMFGVGVFCGDLRVWLVRLLVVVWLGFRSGYMCGLADNFAVLLIWVVVCCLSSEFRVALRDGGFVVVLQECSLVLFWY